MFTKKIILLLFLGLTLFIVGCDRGQNDAENDNSNNGNSSTDNMINITTPAQQVVSSQAQQLFVDGEPVIEFRV